MGTNLPYGRTKTLVWLEAHIDAWSLDPAAIGLTGAQVAQLQGDIAGVRDDFTGVQEIRAQSEARTEQFHSSADDLHDTAADLILAIKSFAATSGNSAGVYNAAGMTPKQSAKPAATPDQPGDLRARLNGTGTVTITWSGRGPTGTVYNVMRRLHGETVFAIIGQGSGREKSIVDGGVPAGTTRVTYVVQAVRGGDVSAPSSAMSVLFGARAPAEAAEIGRAA